MIEKVFGEDGPSKTVLTLPLIRKNQDVFEKQPKKQPEKQPKRKTDYTKSDIVERRTEAIINYIKRNPESSRSQIARDLSFTEGEVRTVIEQLKENGRIHHVGATRGGHWIVDDRY